jgi:cytochrome c-type biogenesis protein CcmE
MTSGRRWPLTLIGLITVGLLIVAGLQDTLTFYRTPSETSSVPAGDRVRVGGTVVPGSVVREGDLIRFHLTDGVRDVVVQQHIDIPGRLREGQQAVVEGVLDGRGVLHADTVMSKHNNTYEPPPGGEQPGRETVR